MSAKDVVEGLRQSGTRGRNLELVEKFLERRPHASGQELVEHLAAEPKVSPVTVAKARHLADGRPLSDLLGRPPANAQAEALNRFGDAVARLADVHGDRQADAQAQGVGLPRKPAETRK